MVTLKNKKELNVFIENIPEYIDLLIKELNEKGISGDYIYFEKNIDEIQNFYRQNFFSYSEEKQNILQQAFWAFCIKVLMDKLGGEIIIAPKNDYTPYTPLLINYGNLYNKKGKKSWVSISFDSWFNSSTIRTHFKTLQEMIEGILEKYGNTEE
ncbi:hypothetical protein, partial [Dysgonomonas sp. 511]|uniref:hypothetical protein n=1 Tax=Dysgonomonas sp. 511 TaxID=2302930 RepID=UPI0013D80E5B